MKSLVVAIVWLLLCYILARMLNVQVFPIIGASLLLALALDINGPNEPPLG